MIYDEIIAFCKVKNKGTFMDNTEQMPTPRVQFIIEILEENEIPYDLNMFIRETQEGTNLYGWNVILMGTSNRMVTAHHDIVNPDSDNANDNSCSVINAIALKMEMPDLNVVLLDGEEVGGIGADHLSRQIVDGFFGDIEWVLNLELTGRGGKNFLIDATEGLLHDRVELMFPDTCHVMGVPFNDSVIFRSHGIDSIVINPLPLLPDGRLDMSVLYLCHSMEDSIDKISTHEMKEFVEEVLIPICT